MRRFDVVISAILLAVCLLLAHKRRQAQRIRDRQNQDVRRATPGECVHARDRFLASSPSPLLLSCLGASPKKCARARRILTALFARALSQVFALGAPRA